MVLRRKLIRRRRHAGKFGRGILLCCGWLGLNTPMVSSADAAQRHEGWSPAAASPVITRQAALRSLLAAPASPPVLRAIKRSLTASEWQALGRELQQRAEAKPGSAAQVAYGHWLLRDNKPQLALSQLQKALASSRVVDTSAQQSLLAEALVEAANAQGPDEPQAAFELRLAAFRVQRASTTPQELERLSIAAKGARAVPLLIDVLRPLVEARPADKALWFALAQALTWVGDFQAAQQARQRSGQRRIEGLPLNLAPEPDPRGAPANTVASPTNKKLPRTSLADQADRHLGAGDEVAALRIWQSLAQQHPSWGRAWLGLGQLHHRQGRSLMAVEAWSHLLRLERPAWRAQLSVAKVLLDHQLFEQAKPLATKAMQVPAGTSQALPLLARIAEAQGDTAEALEHWRSLFEGSLNTAGNEHLRLQSQARMAALFASLQPQRRAEWLSELTDRIAKSSVSPARKARQELLAALQAAVGLTDEAIETLSAALEAHPGDIAVGQQGLLLLKQSRQTAAALRWLGRVEQAAAHEQAPTWAWAQRELAEIHQLRGNAATAESLLMKAQARVPSLRHALRLARLQELRQAEDPNAHARAVGTLAPLVQAGHEPAKRLLMEVLARHGEPQTAFALGLATAKAEGEASSRWWQELADLCLAAGCTEALEAEMAMQTTFSPERDDVYLTLLEGWLPALAEKPGGSLSARQEQQLALIKQSALAPLWRDLLTSIEPQPARIALAAWISNAGVAEVLAHRVEEWLKAPRGKEAFVHRQRVMSGLWALGHGGHRLPKSLIETALSDNIRDIRLMALWTLGAVKCTTTPAGQSPSASSLLGKLQESMESRDATEAALAIWATAQQHSGDGLRTIRTIAADASRPELVRAVAIFAAEDLPSARKHMYSISPTVAGSSMRLLARAGPPEHLRDVWLVALSEGESLSSLARSALARSSEPRCEALVGLGATVSDPAAALSPLTLGKNDTWEGLQERATHDTAVLDKVVAKLEATGAEVQLVRAALRLAQLQGSSTAPPSQTVQAWLERMSLSGPGAARPAAVAARHLAGAQISSLEINRAIAAADAPHLEVLGGLQAVVDLLKPAVMASRSLDATSLCRALRAPASDEVSWRRKWVIDQLATQAALRC